MAIERVPIERACEILGLKSRTIQKMALRGEIPGAVKFGRRWTFNEERLRQFVRDKEGEQWHAGEKLRQECTGGMTFSTRKNRSRAKGRRTASTLTIRQLLKRGATNG